MAEESQNALLKTLEEPPSYAHLILITAEPGGAAGDGPQPLPGDRLRPAPAGDRRAPARRRAARAPPPSSSRRSPALGRRRPRPRADARLPDRLADPRHRRALLARRRRRRGRRAALDRPALDRRRARKAAGRGGRRGGRRARRGATAAAATPTGSAARGARPPSAPIGARGPRRSTWRSSSWPLVHRPRRGRRGSAGAGPQRRPDRRLSPRTEGASIRSPLAQVGRAAMATRRRLGVNVSEELALDALFHRAARLLGERGSVL